MTDLVAFLRARLDEDEQLALAATFEETHPHGNHWHWGEVGDVPAPTVRDGYLRGNGGLSATVSLITVETYNSEGRPYPAEVLHSASHVHPEVAEHIVRHDPARALAESGAKRAILEHVAYEMEDHGADNPWWYDGKLRPILEHLAAVYADHPDYRKEWTP